MQILGDKVRGSKITKWFVFILIFSFVLYFLWEIIGVSVQNDFETFAEDLDKQNQERLYKFKSDNEFYQGIDSLMNVESYPVAIEMLKYRMLVYQNDHSQILLSIGIVYFNKGDLDSALYYYTDVIKDSRTNVRAYALRSEVFMQQDSFLLAINDLKIVCEYQRDYYPNLAYAQEKYGLLQDAYDSYSNYLVHYPDNEYSKNKIDSLAQYLK